MRIDLQDFRDQLADILDGMSEEAQLPYVTCCMGAVVYGPSRCTCWVSEYDLEQLPATGRTPAEITKCCDDCAYRSGSPERSGDAMHACSALEAGELPDIPTGGLFFCHKGMRRIIAVTHESTGLRIEFTQGDNYAAPNHDGKPILASGDFAPLCAGFAAITGRSTAEALATLDDVKGVINAGGEVA